MHIHIRRVLRAVACTGGLAAIVAACIANPGSYVFTAGSETSLTLKDGSGGTRFTYSLGPECGDGLDNDLDNTTDSLDAGCASNQDASERSSGLQTFVSPTVPVNVASDGTFTVKANRLNFPEVEINGIGVTVQGVGSTITSYSEDNAIAIDLPLKVNLVGLAFLQGMDCSVGPYTGHFRLQSYDSATGKAVFSAVGAPVRALEESDCPSPYYTQINDALGLPGTADVTLSGIVANSAGEHPHG
jgi:hypothetical protein